MGIDKAGHQVEPVTIDCLSSFWNAQLFLRLNLIDPIAHDDDCLAGNCDPLLHIHNRHICNSVTARRDSGG